MCGVTGFLRYQTELEDEVIYRVMSILFPRLMCEIETRGQDAAGVYQVHSNGDWALAKTTRKASSWLMNPRKRDKDDPVLFEDFIDSWFEHPFPIRGMVGHARKATVGSQGRDNKDNHPFAVQLDEKNAILGVHNGTLINHERIFTRLKELGSPLERKGTVDSEALFHLLYHASDAGTRPWTVEDIYSVARKVDGAYAVVAMNSRFPNQAVVMRDNRPLEAAMISPLNVVVLASEKRFLEDSIAEYSRLRRFSYRDLPELGVEIRMIAERTCRLFNLDKRFPKGKPTWADLDVLAESRNLNNSISQLPDEEWRKSTTAVSYSPPSHQAHGNQVGTHAQWANGKHNGQAKNTAQSVSKPTVMGPTAKTKPEPSPSTPVQARVSKKEPLTAELTIPDEDKGERRAKEAARAARFIDLAPTFDSAAELSQALGITGFELEKLSDLEIATRVCELGFVQGYGMGRVDSETEVERVRSLGRKQSKELELAQTKREKAQNLVWEMRMLLIALCVLNEFREDATEESLQAVLMELFKEDEDRVSRVMKTYERMVEDGTTQKLRETIRMIAASEEEIVL